MKLLDLIMADCLLHRDGVTWDGVDQGGYAGTICIECECIPAKMFSRNTWSAFVLSSVRKIHERAFEYSAVQWSALPDCIEEIGDYAFLGCESRGILCLPKVFTIGRGAFEACTRLKELTLGSLGYPVKQIGTGAFFNMPNLDTLIIYVDDRLNPPPGNPWGYEGTTLTFKGAHTTGEKRTGKYI